MDSGLAISLLVILGFGFFILWAKTPRGRSALQQAFGPSAFAPRKRATASRKKPSSRSTTGTTAKPKKRSSAR